MIDDKTFRRQIENIKRQKLAAKKIVNLADFRKLKQDVDAATILVVDDDEIMRNAIKRILESEGYSIVTAKDGLELSKAVETRRLDVILLDVNLPWVDGYELAQLIKNHRTLQNVPFIFVSAQKTSDDIAKGLGLGAIDYITKPFDVDYMTQVVRKTLTKMSS